MSKKLRFISLLLIMCMLFSITAFAAETDGTEPDSGIGGDTDPDVGEGTNPDEGEGTDPGEEEGTTPDEGEDTNPDDGEGTNPDEGEDTNPDDGEDTDPDEGEDTNPDDGEDTNPDDGEDEPTEPYIISVSADFESVPKYIKVGDTIDITQSTVTVKYSDETGFTEYLSEENLPEEIDTSSIGRLYIPVTAYDTVLPLYVIVMNEDTDMSVYTDLVKTYWGYKGIRRCVMAGFFKGVSATEFNTGSDISRAEFCQMIYNIYKNDPVVMNMGSEVAFPDVEEGRWYYDAVTACASSGIVLGTDEGTFKPGDPITRQDAALIMMRIIVGSDALAELDVEKTLEAARENGITAVDFDKANNYAKPALAASLGVIYNGNDAGELMPKSNISRAECATMISNYFFADYTDPAIKKLVYLSPSNQMSNKYVGVDTTEGEQMYIVAEYAKAELEEMGYEVYVAEVSKSIKGDDSRAAEAKEMGADVYVALHTNAVSVTNNGKYQGAVCFYNGNNTGAKELAQAVFDRVSALTPTEDNTIKDDMLTEIPYAEIRLPEMANIILEIEYHDYSGYAQWIVDNVESIGESVALGIDDYFTTLGI